MEQKQNADVEHVNVIQFLKELQIDESDKYKLIACFAVAMASVAQEVSRDTTAACMGLSTDDPKFNAFYNNDIAPIVKIDDQSVYADLVKKIME